MKIPQEMLMAIIKEKESGNETFIQPLQQEITSSFLFGDDMVENGIFWTIGEQ